MYTDLDRVHMARAIALAERGLYTTSPNPRVGCVIARESGVVGEGWHVRAGGPHAEIVALEAAGVAATGATVYVSLEPCDHHGRTPPCSESLIAARVARVVAAMADPNPCAEGGTARLRAAGIAVDIGLLEDQARELNLGFVSRLERGVPWVRMKIAATLDGKTALDDGQSQWITGPEARRDGHHFRARACAVLTGIGTVRDDDPRLTVREVETPRQPLRVLVDSRLEVSPQAKLLEGGNVLIACAVEDDGRAARLTALGAEVAVIPNESGKVELPALMRELARRGVGELHVEAGSKLNGSLLREGLVDELVVYLAPSLMGETGQGMANLAPIARLADLMRLEFRDVRRLGGDIRVIARLLHSVQARS